MKKIINNTFLFVMFIFSFNIDISFSKEVISTCLILENYISEINESFYKSPEKQLIPEDKYFPKSIIKEYYENCWMGGEITEELKNCIENNKKQNNECISINYENKKKIVINEENAYAKYLGMILVSLITSNNNDYINIFLFLNEVMNKFIDSDYLSSYTILFKSFIDNFFDNYSNIPKSIKNKIKNNKEEFHINEASIFKNIEIYNKKYIAFWNKIFTNIQTKEVDCKHTSDNKVKLIESEILNDNFNKLIGNEILKKEDNKEDIQNTKVSEVSGEKIEIEHEKEKNKNQKEKSIDLQSKKNANNQNPSVERPKPKDHKTTQINNEEISKLKNSIDELSNKYDRLMVIAFITIIAIIFFAVFSFFKFNKKKINKQISKINDNIEILDEGLREQNENLITVNNLIKQLNDNNEDIDLNEKIDLNENIDLKNFYNTIFNDRNFKIRLLSNVKKICNDTKTLNANDKPKISNDDIKEKITSKLLEIEGKTLNYTWARFDNTKNSDIIKYAKDIKDNPEYELFANKLAKNLPDLLKPFPDILIRCERITNSLNDHYSRLLRIHYISKNITLPDKNKDQTIEKQISKLRDNTQTILQYSKEIDKLNPLNPKKWVREVFIDFADFFICKYLNAVYAKQYDDLINAYEIIIEVLEQGELKPFDIVIGKTKFDSALHIGRSSVLNKDMPDGVIANIIRSGFIYTNDNKVFRQPEVVVNKL